MSVSCSLVVTCRERAGLPVGALVCEVYFCFITFQYSVSVQVWYLIVSISDLYLFPYFGCTMAKTCVIRRYLNNVNITILNYFRNYILFKGLVSFKNIVMATEGLKKRTNYIFTVSYTWWI